jgi:hypothetical protein
VAGGDACAVDVGVEAIVGEGLAVVTAVTGFKELLMAGEPTDGA